MTYRSSLLSLLFWSLLFVSLESGGFGIFHSAHAQEKPLELATAQTLKEWPQLRAPMPELVYPEEAASMAVEGSVVVEFTIDKAGNVQNARVIKSVGYGCDQSALDFIEQLKFDPAAMPQEWDDKQYYRTNVTFRLT